jgi:hypothetical protein
MLAMKAMGYRAVGLGKEEFALGLHEALAEYSLQPGNDEPALVGANLIGFQAGDSVLAKALAFPNAKGNGTSIHDWALIPTKGNINVGVVGVTGGPIAQEIKKIDGKMVFADTPKLNTKTTIENAFKEMGKQKVKPGLNVLLYAGPIDLAKKAATEFPQFRVVVCRSDDPDPPNAPTMVKHKAGPDTMIVRVGHKGQNIGVIGVFGDGKSGYDLQYQRVVMNPEFDTPEGKEKDNLALQELERYSQLVKQRNYLTMNRKHAHPLQASNPKATYVGSEACAICHKDHGDAGAVWSASKHANAYAALEKFAKKPSLRQFDGECIRCHTVGYDYNSGFVDAVKTPNLKNVGCESCHGPGSQHAAAANNRALALELSPWKVKGGEKLPALEKFKAYNDEPNQGRKQLVFDQAEQAMILRVDRICQSCHNSENDPHFKFEAFWPKVAHSLKPGANVANPPMEKKDDGPKLTPTGKNDGPTILPRDPDQNPPKR